MTTTIILEVLFTVSLAGVIFIIVRGLMRIKNSPNSVTHVDAENHAYARKSVGEMFERSMKKITDISSNHIAKTKTIRSAIPSKLDDFSYRVRSVFEENKDEVLMKKGSASFFLKEITEHKKKLEK